MTCARSRTIFGSTSYNSISRFLKEIPEEYLSEESELVIQKPEEKTWKNDNYEWNYGGVKTYKEKNSYGSRKPYAETT